MAFMAAEERALAQCVRNIMIRKTYHPPQSVTASAGDALTGAVRNGALSIGELLRRYCALV